MDYFRNKAKLKLTKPVFDYIDGAAGDEWTSKENCKAFQRYTLIPRVLRNVANPSTELEMFTTNFSFPLMLAPTACHKLVEPQFGEISSAKAALSCGLPLVLSSMSSVSAIQIADNVKGAQLWQQLYLFKDRKLTLSLIESAENAGVKAFMLTLGLTNAGARKRDEKNKFTIPIEQLSINSKQKMGSISINDIVQDMIDPSITWDDILWIKNQTDKPIILKGILCPTDAKIATEIGIDGIVVSNHGGRLLDGTIPSILALAPIVQAVNNRIKILFDGGIRHGSDILKAYALGADAVMIGRPVLWALAHQGTKSLTRMLETLQFHTNNETLRL